MRSDKVGQRVPNPTAVVRMTEGSYICSYDPVLKKEHGKPAYRAIEHTKPGADPRQVIAANGGANSVNARQYDLTKVFSLPQFARQIPTNRCIIEGIDKLVQRAQIVAAFSIVGSLVNATVERCQLHTSRETGQSLGVVDVRFSKVEAAVELRKICNAHKLVLAAQPAPNVRYINYTEETDLQEILKKAEKELAQKTSMDLDYSPKSSLESADFAAPQIEEFPSRDFTSTDPKHVARWFERHLPPQSSYILVRSRSLRPEDIPGYQVDDMFVPFTVTKIIANIIGYHVVFPGPKEAVNCFIRLSRNEAPDANKYRFFLKIDGYTLTLQDAYYEQNRYVREEVVKEVSEHMRRFLRNQIADKLRTTTRDAVAHALHETLDPGKSTKSDIDATVSELDQKPKIEPGTLMNYTFDARKRRVDETKNAKKRHNAVSPSMHSSSPANDANDAKIASNDASNMPEDERDSENVYRSSGDDTVRNSPNSIAGLVDKMDISPPYTTPDDVKSEEYEAEAESQSQSQSELQNSSDAAGDTMVSESELKLPIKQEVASYGPKPQLTPIDYTFTVKRPQRRASLAEPDILPLQASNAEYSRFAEYDSRREYDSLCAPLLQLKYNRAFSAVDHSNKFMQSIPVLKRKRATFRPRAGRAQHLPHRTFVGRSSIHAWGLFAGEDIPEKKLVIEYVGTRIRAGLADVRELQYQLSGVHSTYFFRVGKDAVIDATSQGNAARFMNHSCDPNCDSAMLKVDDIERVGLFTTRAISKNEELTFNYRFTPSGDNEDRLKCHCGAPNCSTYLT